MTGAPALLRVAFVGGFSACFVEPVRTRLAVPCELVQADERDIVARMPRNLPRRLRGFRPPSG